MGNKNDSKIKGVTLPAAISDKVEDIFSRLDSNGDGHVIKTEMTDKICTTTNERTLIMQIFAHMDQDKSNYIDKEEFYAFWKVQIAKDRPLKQIEQQIDKLTDKLDKRDLLEKLEQQQQVDTEE